VALIPRASSDYLDAYSSHYESYKAAADLGLKEVQKILDTLPFSVHLVTARAKDENSVRRKLRRKRYEKPSTQLTDLIGIRVITYYSDEVDQVADLLKQHFRINKKMSEDKRVRFAYNQFGYQSVHLIAKLASGLLDSPNAHILKTKWFEIQIRSILDHAWAEIEHEVVYKSDLIDRQRFSRRFAAISGTLWMLEREFIDLRAEKSRIIEQHLNTIRNGEGDEIRVDACSLTAYMEFKFPSAVGWRSSSGSFFSHSDVVCSEALRAFGHRTLSQLDNLYQGRRFRNAVKNYAVLTAISPDQTSHLAATVIALGLDDSSRLTKFFPELVSEYAIRVALKVLL
jgi:putative GTP pyrophosphokinase